MRWFLILPVATAAFVLADPAPAKAQIIIGGNPTYYPRYSGPFVQYPRVVYPAPAPVTPAPVPYFNGSPVELALDSMWRSVGWTSYGPYAGYSAYANPSYYSNLVNPANYAPWNGYRNFTAPNWKPVNPGLPKGFLKGGKGR
jgi:hypothetical protein